MNVLNLTPHELAIQLEDGSRITLPPSGIVARVTTSEVPVAPFGPIPTITRTFGEVEGLPAEDVPCIVSAMVLAAVPGRPNTYAPDSGATAIRNEMGLIEAVTRLVAA